MLQEVIWVCCDQFYALFVLSALWYYDQQKSEVGRGRDWEEWDSGCHRTSDSDPTSNFDVHNMCLDMMNIFRITIVTCRRYGSDLYPASFGLRGFWNFGQPASIWRRIETRKVLLYVMDEVLSSMLPRICPDSLIVDERVLPGLLLPTHGKWL